MAAVQRAISRPVHAVEQDGHVQGGHLLVGDGAAGVGVDGPVDLASGLSVPLSRLVRMMSTASKVSSCPVPHLIRSGFSGQVLRAEGVRQHLGPWS